jgi:hypothetical protein
MNEAETLQKELQIEREQGEFFALLAAHFDAAFYLATYGDAANSGIDPLQHWLNCGLKDGRQISRSVVLRHGNPARRSSSRIWKHYQWRGQDIAVRFTKPIPAEVTAQILDQARHEPAVLAVGADAVAKMSQQDRENVHLDVAGLRRALPHRIEFLLIVPSVGGRGAQGFVADLVAALSDAGLRPIQTIVVDEESPPHFDRSTIAEPLRNTDLLFWHDFWIHGPEAVNLSQLAQLVSLLRPHVTIVADSPRGSEMIARFGRALSQRTELYWLCSEAPAGNEIDARLAPLTLPFATALTEDGASAERLRQRYGNLADRGIVALPRRPPAALRDAVTVLFRRT